MASVSASKPRLDDIPAEVVEKIADELTLFSICSLRLTCKTLSDRCSGPRFRLFLEHQGTDLTASSLGRLCQLAKIENWGQPCKI